MWWRWGGWDQAGILNRDLEDARTRSGRRLVALFQRFCRFKGDGGGSHTVGWGGRVVDGSLTDGNVLLRLPFPLRGKLKSLLGRGSRLMAPAREWMGLPIGHFSDATALPKGSVLGCAHNCIYIGTISY